jgi:hypothetical protein
VKTICQAAIDPKGKRPVVVRHPYYGSGNPDIEQLIREEMKDGPLEFENEKIWGKMPSDRKRQLQGMYLFNN